MAVKETVSAVTERIIARSRPSRRRYLDKIDAAVANTPKRKALGDTALAARGATGASPAQLLGEAAHAVGLWPTGTPLPVAALPALFA